MAEDRGVKPKIQIIRVRGGPCLQGTVRASPSKSHSIRAILLGALAAGESRLDNLLPSPDIDAMIRAVEQLGAKLTPTPTGLTIRGTSGKPLPAGVVDGGNSGQVLRFVGGVAACANGHTLITGDASLQTHRPVAPLLHGIRQLGGVAYSVRGQGAPILVRGPLKAGVAEIEGYDSQPVTALLIAMSLLKGTSTLHVLSPGETPWLELTLHWLRKVGISLTHTDYQTFEVKGGKIAPFSITLPGDYSSALYPTVASLITGSSVKVTGLDPDDPQGDKAAIDLVQGMEGGEIDVNPFIDALPLLAVWGCFVKGKTVLRGGTTARSKECDRIAAITSELKKMGARITELEDGLIVEESELHGANVSTYHDHRIAMSLAVAAMGAKGETRIENPHVVAKSYPTFWEEMRRLGCEIS